jgi:L-rhamnose isomerase
MALQTLKAAFNTDVEPILAMARYRAGGANDPVGVYRLSDYRHRMADAARPPRGGCRNRVRSSVAHPQETESAAGAISRART